jgi:hypothetical protein
MATLTEIILKDGVRPRVIADGVVLVDEEVAARKGISGLAIKGGYKFVKTIKKTFVQEALDRLLDEFVAELEPLYGEHGQAQGFEQFLVREKSRAADNLLKVTDRRRQGVSTPGLGKAYDKLRPMAQSNVEQAIPRLARLMQKYIDEQAS